MLSEEGHSGKVTTLTHWSQIKFSTPTSPDFLLFRVKPKPFQLATTFSALILLWLSPSHSALAPATLGCLCHPHTRPAPSLRPSIPLSAFAQLFPPNEACSSPHINDDPPAPPNLISYLALAFWSGILIYYTYLIHTYTSLIFICVHWCAIFFCSKGNDLCLFYSLMYLKCLKQHMARSRPSTRYGIELIGLSPAVISFT